MNLLKAFGASTILFAVTTLPASAGGLIDTSKCIAYWVNDGNPRLAITDGFRATVVESSKVEYPVDGEVYGETKTYKLSQQQKKRTAKMLNECNAVTGGSWGTEFTYRYYAEGTLWFCRK